ncbi:MAG: MBL fold metallo-hydrolase [Chloroflexota bacterium]|nr:MBL fold metallo-hydrolase [Chloroflexota bacterium]
MSYTIVQISTFIARCYLVTANGEEAILIDSGWPNSAKKILKIIDKTGIMPSLILLTHGHVDHQGNAAEIREATGARIAVHQFDADLCRDGTNGTVTPSYWFGRLMKPILNRQRVPSFEPDIVLQGGEELSDLGFSEVNGRIVHTPGHTPGSISLLLDSGELFVGDLVIPPFPLGMLPFWSSKPGIPFIITSPESYKNSIEKLLEFSPKMVYSGHGSFAEYTGVRKLPT